MTGASNATSSAARRTRSRIVEGARRDDCRRGIVDRRLDQRGARRGAGGIRASTEPYARLGAQTIRTRLATTWGIAETGATGPTGNPYGDAAGHSCIAISGPVERAITLETGRADRVDNMWAFSEAALQLLIDCLTAARR